MSSQQQNQQTQDTGVTPTKRAESPRPNKPLPTNRISFAKQLDLIRAWVAAAGNQAGSFTTYAQVAGLVGIAESTVGLATPFLTDVGLLIKGEGLYAPSNEAVDFARAHKWNPETAGEKFAPLFARKWFGRAILPRLALQSIKESAVVGLLADACSAGPKYEAQLRVLVDYMEAAGLIRRDGGLVSEGPVVTREAELRPSAHAHEPDAPVAERADPASNGGRTPAVATTLTAAQDGGVQFSINVNVAMTEFRDWAPERITAFFTGVAQVLAAKGAVEQKNVS